MKQLLATLMLGLCLSLVSCVVWEKPYATRYKGKVEISRVEFKPRETLVTFRYHGSGDIRMDSATYLLVDSTRYMIRNHPDAPTNKWVDACINPVTFHFAPLPKRTREFDLIEEVERGFVVKGIVNLADTLLGLYPSSWRDDSTGDWLLTLLPEHAIFESRVWQYDQRTDEPDGGVALTLVADGHRRTLHLGPETDLVRQITLDGSRTVGCSRFMKYLPDYPVPDTRTSFTDTGYLCDTAVVRGWLRGMTSKQWAKGWEFNVEYSDFFTDEIRNCFARMDSIGQFELKVPLYGATEVYCDWGRTTLNTMLEPGQEYFFFVDFSTGQRVVMGDDCRLQNELLAHDMLITGVLPDAAKRYRDNPDSNADHYLDTLLTHQASIRERREQYLAQHPLVSSRYRLYADGRLRTDMAYNLSRAYYWSPSKRFTPRIVDYLNSEYFSRLPRPYTLYRDLPYNLSTARTDDAATQRRRQLDECERLGYLTPTADEKRIFQMVDSANLVRRLLSRAKISEDSLKLWLKANPWLKAAYAERDSLMESPRGNEIEQGIKRYWKLVPSRGLDHLGISADLRDLCAASDFCRLISYDHSSYSNGNYEMLLDSLKHPGALAAIKARYEHYKALSTSGSHAIKNAADVKDITEGEAILAKLVEPYRGRCIVVDVWGLWCGSCVTALRNSTEEFAKLDPHNVVYLYLANRSEESAWRQFIVENKLTSPNCVHYNLPEAQQSAVENFLGVHSWPSYFLIDPDGHVLDQPIDVRRAGIDEVVQLVKELNAKRGGGK